MRGLAQSQLSRPGDNVTTVNPGFECRPFSFAYASPCLQLSELQRSGSIFFCFLLQIMCNFKVNITCLMFFFLEDFSKQYLLMAKTSKLLSYIRVEGFNMGVKVPLLLSL